MKKTMRDLAALIAIGLLAGSPAQAADPHKPVATGGKPEATALVNEQTPRLRLLEPPASFLKDGYVYLPFRVENITILS